MPTKNLLRHIFRHGPRETVNAELKPHAPTPTTNTTREPSTHNNPRAAHPAPPKTPEPFGLSDIKEEDTRPNTPSSTSSTSPPLSPHSHFTRQLSTFTPSSLLTATLREAQSALSSHLDTLTTTLAVLDALEGFSPTIGVLGEEMREKRRVCEEQVEMLEAVGRFVGEGEEGEYVG